MIQRGMGALVIRVAKVAVVSGCVIGVLTGCSSRLRTTIVSGSDAPKVQVTQLEPEHVVVEEVLAQPLDNEDRMNIPVEEPARPAPRRELPSEIFTTTKSPVIPAEISPRSESETLVPSSEGTASSLPSATDPSMQRPSTGIPPIVFEPEMPALPRSPHDASPSTSQEAPMATGNKPEAQSSVQPRVIQPEAGFPQQTPVEELHATGEADSSSTTGVPVSQESFQVAKVIPQEPEQVEIMSETLEEALNDIYFDYDQFAIREDSGALLKANARLLTEEFANTNIVIEGHCDERGTQSYNMVLGERRAKAVRQFLQDLGVAVENLQVVSYGKDKPFCTEATEACWQENRRGHFVIK